jgi:hypothetical protein
MRRLCTMLLLMTIPLTAHAALLGTVPQTYDMGISPQAPHEARAEMTYDYTHNLFDDVVLTAASTGLILTATGDLDYNTVVGTLTNGALDILAFGVHLGVGASHQTWEEKNWFSLSTNDFAGANITSITLTVDEISFEDQDPWTNLHIKYTVRVYGETALAVQAATWGGIKALYR